VGRFQKTVVETPARDVAGNCPDADSPLGVVQRPIFKQAPLLLRLMADLKIGPATVIDPNSTAVKAPAAALPA
jgi:hypothetical protein